MHDAIYQYKNNYYCNELHDIILSDKYEAFWTGDIMPYMLSDSAIYFSQSLSHNLMTKYHIKYNVIIASKFLQLICINESILILERYPIYERTQIIRAIFDRSDMLFTGKILLKYMLNNCDYTVEEWKTFNTKSLSQYKKINSIILIYVNLQILYHNSLRNTWILSCSSF